ncbi:hypothetical protein [Chryseobacterium wanjuense]
MSNTLDLLETNDFQTEPINLNGIITLIDSETKELVNLVEISSLPEVSPPVTSPPVPPVLVTPDNIMYFEKDSRFFKRDYRGVINPEWFGTGKTHVEIQAAIDIARPNDTILIKGEYKCSDQITINKTLTFMGQNHINGNDVGGNENSRIYFVDFENSLVDSCIESDTNLNIKNLAIFGSEIEGKTGVKVTNGALTLDSATIQVFETGVEVTAGYYNKFLNSSIVSCQTCLVLNNCYNTNATSLSIGAGYAEHAPNSKGIVLTDGTNLNMFGGSIEGFSEIGIDLSASRVSCFGTYFEGIFDEENENTCIKIQNNNCRVTAVSCHVYLTAGKANSFVHIPSTIASAHIHSKNNYFEYEPVNDWYTAVYRLAATNFTNYNIDISGDNYQNDLVTGSSYISITSSLLEKGKGIVQISYPSGHQLAGIHLTNLNTISPYQYTDDILKLQNGTITTFRNNGGIDDDPLDLHTEPYGYNPYTVVLENGAWKKIPKI